MTRRLAFIWEDLAREMETWTWVVGDVLEAGVTRQELKALVKEEEEYGGWNLGQQDFLRAEPLRDDMLAVIEDYENRPRE